MRRTPVLKYDYLSGGLLTAAYKDLTGRVPSPPLMGDLPALARHTERHLVNRALPLKTATPGRYLHIADADLDLIDRSAGPGSWTAAVITNRQDSSAPDAEQILLVMLGPIEDCREWQTDGQAPRMPAAITPQALEEAIAALAAQDGSGNPGDTAPQLAQALTEMSFWPQRREALASVIIRQPARPPYTTIVIGTPDWVRTRQH